MSDHYLVIDTNTNRCVEMCDTEDQAWCYVHTLVSREADAWASCESGRFVQSDPLMHEHYTVRAA